MSDESSIDAESVTRNRKYDAGDHLQHLLKVGHDPSSPTIKEFVRENGLEATLKRIIEK